MTCGPNIQRRRDIYDTIIRKPWISETELYEKFGNSSKTEKAIYIGLRKKIFLRHVHNNRQITYIVNPELNFEEILRYIGTYAMDKIKVESLKRQYLTSSKLAIRIQHENRQKALSSIKGQSFARGLSTRHISQDGRVKYIKNVGKLQAEIENTRKYRKDMGLNGVDRGALK